MYYFSCVQGFKVAYVVFKKMDSLKKAKCLPFSKTMIISTKDNPLDTGMKSKYQLILMYLDIVLGIH